MCISLNGYAHLSVYGHHPRSVPTVHGTDAESAVPIYNKVCSKVPFLFVSLVSGIRAIACLFIRPLGLRERPNDKMKASISRCDKARFGARFGANRGLIRALLPWNSDFKTC